MSRMRDYDEIIRRNRAFINMEEVERPLFGIWVGSYMPFQIYNKASEKLSFSNQSLITPEALNPKGFLADIDRLFWEHEQVGDDLIWAATPLIGVLGFCRRQSMGPAERFWLHSNLYRWLGKD